MPATLQHAVTRTMNGRDGAVALLRISDGLLLARHRPDFMKSAEAPPGSAVKPFTLKALLRGGASTALCRRTLSINGQRLDCSHPPVSEPLTPASALALSCNSWFAAMASKLPPELLWRELNAAGLTAGIARSRDSLILQALGIDGVQCTPLAMARAYRRLALDRANSPAQFTPLYEGLADSVNRGTSMAAGPGVLGKTGTTKDGAWFAGFNQEIVLAVYLFLGTGGADAAPIAGEVFAAWRSGSR